jgi:predicted nucleic-acid-binding protein
MSQSDEVYSIDANVILRFLLGDDPKLYPKAFDIVTGVESGNTIVICDPVNLAEIVWVLKSFYKLSNERIYELLEPIVNLEGFLVPDKERYLLALRLFADGMKSFGDACACASAIQDCGGKLYSYDEKLSGIPGITRTE